MQLQVKVVRALGVGLLVAMTATACKNDDQKKPTPATPVRVALAAKIDAPVNIMASGVVEPMQSVAVTTQVSGTLMDVMFKEGDVVAKGQVMFHIDPRPLQAAVDQVRATLARDEAQADAGRKDDERYQKLADMGYVSRSQADQMHATAAAQTATVAADQASLRAALVNLSFATIRAPISGRTGSLLVRQGNNVSPGGSPLVVINQISPVLVRFPILASDFETLQRAVAAHPINVRAAASDSGSMTNETGQLGFLDNAIDSLTGTVTGKAQFQNTARRLWPGELVFLTVEVSTQRGVIAVPTEAVQTGQQGAYVYVVDAKNAAATRIVATGIAVNDQTVITKGLNAGERVVVDGQSKLNPGSKVAIVTGNGGDTATAQLGSNGGANGAGGTASGEVAPGAGNPDAGSSGQSPNGQQLNSGANGAAPGASSGRAGSTTNGSSAATNLPAQVPNGTSNSPTSGNQSTATSTPGATTTPATGARATTPTTTTTPPTTGSRP
ncbi:MAG TPA: efflux RND transporter periplasmic adaptor subunit [Gemmatimonadaceae bacterium]|jgi:multidrug efflux system membrane fusion protein